MNPAKNTRGPLSKTLLPPTSVCKICRCSIYITDELGWVVSPQPGLAHKICAEEAPSRP